ncbi:membrane-bound lytic murein transglycosylase MltF [Hahella sp. CR1]|uniref:membrane-bound lytic murein transglycosylase MltF n=1 Tax=Hahella sp. CR1 TaxID=2992807 RepID=UPI0024415320|nr:membrane-bound lytic murein transglycosylase MltF [Hahella sp. CR1]MDG9672209.1 membrane-bound lytic murein transglycosylase MltF [Hahella sp. CR1]
MLASACTHSWRTGRFLNKLIRSGIQTLTAAALIANLSACSRPTTLEKIEQEGVLHVITRNAPTTYYEDRDGPAGFEYELAKKFSEYLGVELRLRVASDLDEAYTVLEQNYTNLAAVGLSRLAASAQSPGLRFSSEYLEIQPLVLFRNGSPKPKQVDDLIGGKMIIPAQTAQAEFLRQVKDSRLPDMDWLEAADMETSEIMRLIEEGEYEYAIVNSREYEIHKAMFPRAREAFPLMEPLQISWIFPPGEDMSLIQKADEFIKQIKEDGTLIYLQERYFGHVNQLNYVGARTYISHIKDRLPKFEPTFKQASEKFEVDWRLLASIGYQESHWRPYATSPTGVRGLMMLTLPTAKEMNVKNRLNPEQSIFGGAGYFSRIKQRISERIAEPDRTWMALAAYNIGLGHLEDARALAKMQGMDQDKWIDVKQALPLLQQKKWYVKTRYGYARGWEPVHYVQNIRRYYDVLVWMTQPSAEDGSVAQNEDGPNSGVDGMTEETPAIPAPFRVTPPML